jgi:DNA-directed RNA polymerase alpha subunit
MNPKVTFDSETDNKLSFTLSGVNLSLANAIRRTILSDIEIVVFKTTPYEENKANIITNTSRLNNEIIKQRLSCIPIHITDMELPLNNYIMELNVENITDSIMYVTTEDFKIKNLLTDKYLSDKDTRAIFPPNDYTGYFIDFVRLRPKISDEILGEKIQLTCQFSIGTAKEDGAFNVVSTCSYGFTPDKEAMEIELSKKIQQWKNEGLSKESIEFEKKNWKLLDGLRITKPDSFEFTIETIGVFTNVELLNKATDIIINKFKLLDTLIETDELKIDKSLNTMKNCFDVILENEDYTIGKVLEYILYSKFFENLKTLNYCGFKKEHPHDSGSIIRLAYNDPIDKSGIKQNLKECIIDAINVFKKMKEEFLRLTKS